MSELPPFEKTSDTSREAAISMIGGAKSYRRMVYDYIRLRGFKGATCDEVEIALGLRHTTASGRIWELKQRNLIYDSGLRRKTSSGRNAAVMVASTTLANA